MGVSEYNNMANLLTDCQAGKIDVFAHMGDHCCEHLIHRPVNCSYANDVRRAACVVQTTWACKTTARVTPVSFATIFHQPRFRVATADP